MDCWGALLELLLLLFGSAREQWASGDGAGVLDCEEQTDEEHEDDAEENIVEETEPALLSGWRVVFAVLSGLAATAVYLRRLYGILAFALLEDTGPTILLYWVSSSVKCIFCLLLCKK